MISPTIEDVTIGSSQISSSDIQTLTSENLISSNGNISISNGDGNIVRSKDDNNDIRFTVDDDRRVDQIQIYINGEQYDNISAVASNLIDIGWSPEEGHYRVSIFANDASTNSANFSFNVDVIDDTSSSPPSITVNDPDGAGDSEQEYYIIRYDYQDVDSGGNIAFYYDTRSYLGSTTPEEQFEGAIGTDIYYSSIDFRSRTYVWRLKGDVPVPPGDYYVYARITDGQYQETARSIGKITVEPIPIENYLEIVDVCIEEDEGDGDLVPESGEKIEVRLSLRNTSGKYLQNINGSIKNILPVGTEVIDGDVFFDDLNPGDIVACAAVPDYDLIVHPDNFEGDLGINIHLTYRDADWKAIQQFIESPIMRLAIEMNPPFQFKRLW